MVETAIAKSAHGPSFLRWAGSKRKSLALLSRAYCNYDHRYIEPFAGSAALFFSLRPRRGMLADLNGHLVNAMRYVRDQPRELHRLAVSTIVFGERNEVGIWAFSSREQAQVVDRDAEGE